MADWHKLSTFSSGNLVVDVLGEKGKDYSKDHITQKVFQKQEAKQLKKGVEPPKAKEFAEDYIKKYTYEIGPKLELAVSKAQEVMNTVRDVMAQEPNYQRLSDLEWQRFKWAAWRCFACRKTTLYDQPAPKTPAGGLARRSPFRREQFQFVNDKIYKLAHAFDGANGKMVLKIGFPGVIGAICNALLGGQLGGLVVAHPLQGLDSSDQRTWNFYGVRAAAGHIHLAQDEVMRRPVYHVAHLLIHEAGHRYADLLDEAYLDPEWLTTGKGKKVMKTADCFKNSDSFAMFCVVVSGEWEEWLESGHIKGGYRECNWG